MEGDSAFGFSGMEVETMVRYQLPICLLIINNNGIYNGISSGNYVDASDGTLSMRLPPTALLPDAHYEKMAAAFGG